MNFLLVNDDGFGSTGILLVEEVLKEYGNVYVCAPKEHQSGKGCSLFFSREYAHEVVDNHHIKCDGTPAMCTMVGTNLFDVEFDCVVSGCNDGYNLACDTMYSGTVGACVEALFQRIPAIAVSCDRKFDNVKEEFKKALDYILDNNLLSSEYFLNVNIPPKKKVKGIKLTHLHPVKIKYNFVKNENGTYSYSRSGFFDDIDRKSDVYACQHGYTSISVCKFNLDDEKSLKSIKKSLKK